MQKKISIGDNLSQLVLSLKFCLLFFISGILVAQEQSGTNLALGRKYMLSPNPNYHLCTDKEDNLQLTDGKTTKDYFWTQKGTVGWNGTAFVDILIDLEKISPVDKISLTSAAGRADVQWPLFIHLFVSNNGKEYYKVGDILSQDLRRNGPVDNKNYSIRKFTSDSLSLRCRYVRLLIKTSGQFFFTDEIEILRGSDSQTEKPLSGRIIASASNDISINKEDFRFGCNIAQRYDIDCDNLRKLIEKSWEDKIIKTAEKKTLLDKLQKMYDEYTVVQIPDTKEFKAILPLNEKHAALLALQSELWRKIDSQPLLLRRVNCWESGTLIGLPPVEKQYGPLDLLHGEDRFIALNLYNTTDAPMKIQLNMSGNTNGISVYKIQWTDTAFLVPVASAFIKLDETTGKRELELLPGIVQQVCFVVDSRNVPHGDYHLDISCHSATGNEKLNSISIPYKIWPIDYPKTQTFMTGGWDYTNGQGSLGVNVKNMARFLQLCKEFRVNAPWAQNSVLLSCFFNEKSHEITVDTKPMEEWLTKWPNAKEYYIFLNAPRTFGDQPMGTPEFDAHVAQWAQFWEQWLLDHKFNPNHFHLLVQDEPGDGTSERVEVITAWSKAIRKAVKGFTIWEDPIYSKPNELPDELQNVSEILCPNRVQWYQNKEVFEKYYLPLKAKGKRLQFYSCSGPSRLLDCYYYYLLQAWDSFRIGSNASFFWALGDAGGNNWNEYAIARTTYSPMFFDIDNATIIPGRELWAIKTGVQDYETLLLLQKCIEKVRKDPNRKNQTKKAEMVLNMGVEEVLKNCTKDSFRDLTPNSDRDVSENVRHQIIEQIYELEIK